MICPLSVPCLHHKDARRRTQYILYTNTMCHYPVSGIMIVYAYCHNLGEDKYVHRSCLAQLKKTVWYKHTHFTLVWKWLGTWIQLQHNSTNEWQEMWHPDKSLAGGETLRMGSVLAIWTQDTTEQLLSMVLEWNVIHRIVQLGFRGLTSGDTADWSLSLVLKPSVVCKHSKKVDNNHNMLKLIDCIWCAGGFNLCSMKHKCFIILKGVVHPQNHFLSIDYLCLGHLISIVFFCICRIP